jgi:cell division protein FtsB
MSRRSAPTPVDDALEDEIGAPGDRDGRAAVAPDLAALPIVGITRRRMAILMSALLAAWIVLAFARQVSEASDATARSEGIASTNAAMRLEVAALERELDLIARQRYIEQQARAYGLGGSRETPFTLAMDAPPLPEDAPGSAALRVGARTDGVAPLERWLTVLFGPSG